MAIKSKLRLNQMAEGLALLDGTMENMLDTANAGYAADVVPSEATGTLEETLQKLAKSMQRRFGTTSAGAFNETFGGANTIGEIASFSANDNQDVFIANRASKELKLQLGSGLESHVLMDRVAAQEKVEIRSNTDELLLLDEANNAVTLQATTDNFLKIDDAAANEITTLQHSAEHQLVLDQGNTKSMLKADGSVLDMSKGAATGQGIVDLQSSAANFLKIDGTAGGATEGIVMSSQKDLDLLWDDGDVFKITTTGASPDYQLEVVDDSTATRQDIFGVAGVGGRYQQLDAPTYWYEKDIKSEKARVSEALDYRFSIDTASDHRARLMAGTLASANADKVKDVDGSETGHGVGLQIAAERLNGDQYVAMAAHSQESGVGVGDASFSKMSVNINSISIETVGILSQDSQGTRIHAVKGTRQAALPANYGGANALTAARVGGNPLGDANHIWFRDSHCLVGTNAGEWSESKGIPLSVATKEWEDYEATFGEVSLMNALVSAASGGTTDAGQYIISIGNAGLAADTLIIGEDQANAANTIESDNARFDGAEFNSKDTSAQIDLGQNATKISAFPSSGLDSNEILAAVKVFVNGQLLVGGLASGAPSGGNYDYHICDDRLDVATAYAGSDFSLKFAFALEEGDIVQIFVG